MIQTGQLSVPRVGWVGGVGRSRGGWVEKGGLEGWRMGWRIGSSVGGQAVGIDRRTS